MRTHRVCATAILARVSALDTDPIADLLRGVPFFMGLAHLVAREVTAGEAFDDRQGTRIGSALTLVRFIAIAASLPAWKLMGLL
jgi:hypothetical protein